MKTPAEKLMNAIHALMLGEVSLKFVFWVYGFAGVLAFKWPMRVIEKYGYHETPIYLGVSVLAVVYSAFIVVAVWRSASQFNGNKGWAYAARVIVILWSLSIFWGP